MKQKQRRNTVCHNCQSDLNSDYNFCPVCGQSNSDNNVTFGTLLREFLDNYFGIDSKMAHSAIPFLFSPGSLTNRFNEGKVKHFIHPVRLYFVMSLFYFFTISYLLSEFDLRDFDDEIDYTSATIDAIKDDDLLSLIPDSTKIKLINDTLVSQYPGVKDFGVLYDSIQNKYGKDFMEDTELSLASIEIPKREGESHIDRYHRLARDRKLSDQAFMDSLKGNGNGFSFYGNNDNDNDSTNNFFDPEQNAHLNKQVRKIFENDAGFKGFVLGNLPLMMFILIPLFAGVLKFIYVRRKHLYIKHIVHAMHVHSLAYMIYGLALLVIFKIVTEDNFPNANISAVRGFLTAVIFVLVSTYTYISFLKVYKQGWFKTLIKFNLVGSIYGFFLMLFFFLEVFISFWYY